jgi:hypothetical protein
MAETETEYLMLRAREEAVLAIQAEHPSAAAAHQELSVLYSAKAMIGLADEDEVQIQSILDAPAGGAAPTGPVQLVRPAVG